jgi:hypothetical protein
MNLFLSGSDQWTRVVSNIAGFVQDQFQVNRSRCVYLLFGNRGCRK